MLDQEFLRLIACPDCRGPVVLAGDDQIANLNQQISSGKLSNASGMVVELSIEGGLVCPKDRRLYPIRQQIPLLLNDQALPIA